MTDQVEEANPRDPIPQAEADEADQMEVSDGEDSGENIRWGEEYAREQEINAIKLLSQGGHRDEARTITDTQRSLLRPKHQPHSRRIPQDAFHSQDL